MPERDAVRELEGCAAVPPIELVEGFVAACAGEPDNTLLARREVSGEMTWRNVPLRLDTLRSLVADYRALLSRAQPDVQAVADHRIDTGTLRMWRDDAAKVERWMGGAKSTYDRRTLDLVKAVRELTAEVERLYTRPAPVVTEAMVTKYTIGDTENRDTLHRLIHVEYAGHGRWAVRRNGLCLGTDGEWDFEPLPSSRDDEWLAKFRWADTQSAITAALAAARGEA